MVGCVDETTAHRAYLQRRRIVAQQLEQGLTVGSSCGRELCVSPGHVIVRPWKQYAGQKWGPYAERIAALKMDEYFDLKPYPNDKRAMMRFRNGVSMCRSCVYVKFAVRALPGSGLRIIRVGNYGSYWSGTEDTITTRHYPSLVHIAKWKWNLTSYWLGLCWGTSLHVDQIPRNRCVVRNCVYPRSKEEMCRHHSNFFAYPDSMTDDKLDYADYALEQSPLSTIPPEEYRRVFGPVVWEEAIPSGKEGPNRAGAEQYWK